MYIATEIEKCSNSAKAAHSIAYTLVEALTLTRDVRVGTVETLSDILNELWHELKILKDYLPKIATEE